MGMYLIKQAKTHTLKNNIIKAGRRWQISNNELANEYMHLFLKFVNTVDFETL
jgi:hypothetical protein